MTHDPELINLLARLISIPSVNPEDTNDPKITGEERIADFLGGYLKDKNFAVEIEEQEPGRPNVIGRYGVDDAKETILVEAHLDTVSVKGMTIDAFEAHVEQGRLHGRGACDTKGPMAAALHALDSSTLETLRRSGIGVIFVGAMGEEKGNVGAAHLASKGLGADYAIILEPTDLKIIHAHKGALWYRVDLYGVSGHGSAPERGKNAVVAGCELVQRLQERLTGWVGSNTDPVLGAPTMNIGMFEGGAAVNIIPHHARIEIDRRWTPQESDQDILRETEKIIEDIRNRGGLEDYDIQTIRSRPPFVTTTEGRLVSKLASACQANDCNATCESTPWYSDAGPFAKTCAEVIVFGPGSIEQAHTKDEYIELDSLQKGCDVLRSFFELMAEEGHTT